MNSTYLITALISIAITACLFYLYHRGQLKVVQEKLKQLLSYNQSLTESLEKTKSSFQALEKEKYDLDARLSVESKTVRMLQDQLEKDRENQQTQLIHFENVANKVLIAQAQSFDTHQQKEVQQLLKPLQDQIQRFEQKIERTNDDSNARLNQLKQQIRTLNEKSEQVSQDANNLAKALKGDSKKQGIWGELVLESILDKSGLEKDREYFVQSTHTNREGRRVRPDVIIELPGRKKIIIDSKVSLRAYEELVHAENEEEQKKHQQNHYVATRKHIDDLSAKNYQDIYEVESPDFVLMFIPIDTAYSCAQMYDRSLYQYAFDKNVVIVTPSTLLATLKVVETIWRNDRQNKYALEIATEAGKMYDKFVGFMDDMNKMRKQLKTVNSTFDDSIRKLSEGKGNLIGRANHIKLLGAKANKSLEPGLVDAALAHETIAMIN